MRSSLRCFFPRVRATAILAFLSWWGRAILNCRNWPRARAGDKTAQLELGIIFEEGRGVVRDIEKAESLYRQAASDSSGRIWVYTPSPGDGTGGHVVQVDHGARTAGMPEAKLRLERLTRISAEN